MTYLEYRQAIAAMVARHRAERSTLDATYSAQLSTDNLPMVETASERQIREFMADWFIGQGQGPARRYALLPGHPHPDMRSAAGINGYSFTAVQLRNLLGPYLPPTIVGTRLIETDPVRVMKTARWAKWAK